MRALLGLCALAACEREATTAARGRVLVEDERPAPIEVVGVSALDFRCDSVAPADAVTTALGAVTAVEAQMSPPPGVPRTCAYQSTDPARAGLWSFDIDCREGALAAGEALMVELASKEGAQPIRIGRSGIDAAGSVLLFVDDDAPCYVRVLGPDAERRAALARIVSERPEPRTAPGKVRYR
jgi:hypothetical protein